MEPLISFDWTNLDEVPLRTVHLTYKERKYEKYSSSRLSNWVASHIERNGLCIECWVGELIVTCVVMFSNDVSKRI